LAFVLGAWAVLYACNTATAACKGAAPWPGLEGTMHRGGWVLIVLGIVVMLASAIAGIIRVARRA
jgi:hypothetical protein